MILTTTTATVPFTPAWRTDVATPPVYHLRAGSVIERAQLEAELSGPYRAGRVYGYELREAMRAGIIALMADLPEFDRILGLLAVEEDGLTGSLSAEDQGLAAEVRGALAIGWAPYRDLVDQLERRREIAPVLTFRRFCAGWDNVAATFARGRDGMLSDDALRGLDSLEMLSAGNEAYRMLYPDTSAEGNSSPAAPSESGQTTSPSDATSTAAGKSPEGAGKKTRAPRSRRGSGR